ncbi:MAG: M20 family metallopeptidase [Micrococcales bacterium]
MSTDISALVTEAGLLQADLVKLRRELHQIPEFGLNLPNTVDRVIAEVAQYGEISVDREISAVTLLIKGGKPGPVVLLRADMDALAVQEATGLDFASTNGYMHACGHDLHISMGVGAVRLVHAHREQLAGSVLFWFQPGEEGHGGADLMIERNMHLVEREVPIAAYGLHVFSGMPKGVFLTKSGPLMASAGDALVTFKGRGGHGSMPWLSKDPISVMVEAISQMQTMISKRFSPFDPVIVNVGWVKAGDTHTTNVTPEVASFGATVRTFSDENFTRIREELRRLFSSIAEGYGLEVELEYTPASQVVINTAPEVARAESMVKQTFGEQRWVTLEHPIPGGEDFASVLKEMPGAFIFLGACPPGVDHNTAPSNHSNHAVYDDGVLSEGAALLAGLALDILS